MSNDLSTALFSALVYFDMGLSVFPLAPTEKKPHKQFKCEAFQHNQPSREQIKSWFDGSDNTIAITTDAVSKLLVFDLDGATAKSNVGDIIHNRILQDTRDAILDTFTVETGGGGLHIWFRYDPGEFQQDNVAASEIKNMVLWRGKDGHNEIRLKSNGGYVDQYNKPPPEVEVTNAATTTGPALPTFPQSSLLLSLLDEDQINGQRTAAVVAGSAGLSALSDGRGKGGYGWMITLTIHYSFNNEYHKGFDISPINHTTVSIFVISPNTFRKISTKKIKEWN